MRDIKGFQEQTKGEGNFFVIKHNFIVQESKTERQGFEAIKVRNPRTDTEITKYIKRYKGIEALIKKIEWYDTAQKYDQRYMGWKIHLDTGVKKGVLDIPFDSRPCSRFMKLAENLDFTQPVEFSAWRSPDDTTAFAVKQNDQSVFQKYTRENPGELPPPVQNFKGKWNYDDQMEFLRKRMIEVVIPAVDAAQGKHPVTETAPDESESHDDPPANQNGNGNHPKVLNDIKVTIKALAGTKEVDGATKVELLENYFGTASWSEIEKMDEKFLVQAYQKLDELIPF